MIRFFQKSRRKKKQLLLRVVLLLLFLFQWGLSNTLFISNQFPIVKKVQATAESKVLILNFNQTILTEGTTWTVPSDWTDGNNTIEVIGGGGAGFSDTTANAGAAGGGGGAYSKSVNVDLTPGATVTYQVGTGGLAGSVNGQDTYFCDDTTTCTVITDGNVVVGAKGGTGATSASANGVGGAAASGVASGTGSDTNSGGDGGDGNTTGDTGGGGGGAAGPNGDGGLGGNGDDDIDSAGGGGGGNGGGGAGQAGTASETTGGTGGTNYSAGGAGTGGSAADGGNGSSGGGGGGGDDVMDGGNGSTGVEWGTGIGSGGGGGGVGEMGSLYGGDGGLYGAGGAGGRYGGRGANGIIVITYNGNTPTRTTWTVPADWNDSSNTVEVIGAGGAGYSVADSSGAAAGGGGGYSRATNVDLTPGGTVTYAIGAGGRKTTVGAGAGAAGGATYFCNSTSNCADQNGTASVAGVTGGTGATSVTANGTGGTVVDGSGTAGGAGGDGNNTGDNSGGGGGAGQSGELGQLGGTGGGTNAWGGGGGGGAGDNSGTDSTAGANSTSATGGAGGNGRLNTGDAAGTGGGGDGGNNGVSGVDGYTGNEWTTLPGSATAGAGGGGGGAGDNTGVSIRGGNGGLFGGGGGGGSWGGFGANGIIVITYIPSSNYGGRLFTSGFELQSLTNNEEWSAVGGSPTISTSTVRSGAAALRISSLVSGTAQYVDHVYSAANVDAVRFVRFYFRYVTAPSAANKIFGTINSAVTISTVSLGLQSDGTLVLADNGGVIGSPSSALSANTWYRIEIKYDSSGAGATDTVEAKIDGSVFATSSTRTLSSGSNQFLIGANTNLEAQTQGEWFIDDVAINENVGSVQNGYPGAGSVVNMQPNADGSNTAWGVSGCASDYECVDEIDPDDATTYLTSSTLSQAEDVNLESASSAGISSGDTITLVAPGIRMANSGTSTQSLSLRVLNSSSNDLRTTVITAPDTTWFTNSSSNPRNHQIVGYSQPVSLSAWTATELDSVQVGVRVDVDAANDLRVSALWLTVEYVPTATLTQNDWRLYVDNDGTNPTEPWGVPDLAENEALSALPYPNDALEPTDEIRLRMSIAVTGTDLASSTEGFILQYKEASDCTDGTSWTDVDAGGGGGVWRFATSGVSDGVSITSVLSVSDVVGRYSKTDPTSTNPNAVSAGQDFEWDWHVEYNGTASAHTYCFRMIRDDATTLTAYNSDSYPKLDTRPGVADLMRHGNFFITNIEKGFYWAD